MKHFSRAAALGLLVLLISGGIRPKCHTETAFLMDTVMTITVYGRHGKTAADAAIRRLTELDAMLDAHNPNSELARFNAAPPDTPIAVSRELYMLLERAVDFCEETGGAFDCALLAVSSLWGFGGDAAAMPQPEPLNAALSVSGSRFIELNRSARTVTRLNDTVQLDLGGLAKGYAADEAVRILKEYGIQSACLDLGGNVAVMGGKPFSLWQSLYHRNKTCPFTIGIQKPDAPRGEVADSISLSDGFVVTSGDYERYFEADGMRYHHILDPQTGYPAQTGLKSVTVVAQNGMQADMLSTALFVLGAERGAALTEQCETVMIIDDSLKPIRMKG